MLRFVILLLFIASLILPIVSSYYFNRLMKLIKVRRGNILITGAIMMLIGYIFFMLPWIFIDESVTEIRLLSYIIVLSGLLTLLYGILKIYLDWREVIK
ncbi:MAG: hypothetical protein J7J36_05550 [Thermoplasmata archaeon]|nr:hypothetical protein [Thermoplasmata archaeon]